MLDNNLILSPIPQRISFQTGTYKFSRDLHREVNNFTLSKRLPKELKWEHPEKKLPNEGYILTIKKEEIKIHSSDRRGLFYAIMTLRQLMRNTTSQKSNIPCLRIEDWPEFPVRGVLIDISRDRVPSMETLKQLIDMWSELKYNQLQLYTEHTFAYPSHPLVWKGASPITPQEAEILDEYCRERAIELVPNQNSFGHMEQWLKHRQYQYLAESPGGYTDQSGVFHKYPSTLNPLDKRSLEFLSGLYDELLPHFSSRMLNVGADETWELGKGKSKEACEKMGTGRVYLNFLKAIYREVKKRGKVMQFYGDIILNYPELIKELPRDTIALDWGYEANHPFDKECEAFSQAGIPFYVCAGTSSWNSLGGRWENAKTNILNAATEGLRKGAKGIYITDWGDNGHWQQLPISFPGFVYGAALSWSPSTGKNLNTKQAMTKHVFVTDRSEIAYKLAEVLIKLGSVYNDGVTKLHNAGILSIVMQPLMFPYYKKQLPQYKGYNFEKEREILKEAKQILSSINTLPAEARQTPGNIRLTREELDLTADLMLFAAELARHYFSTPNMNFSEIPLKVRHELSQNLSILIERYKSLWKYRYRPGGLSESAGRMENLLTLLDGR